MGQMCVGISSRGVLFLALVIAAQTVGALVGADAPANVADLRRAFESPPDDARINMRWWWFGPSVTKPELEREMRAMKAGGIGGFEVQPVYALEVGVLSSPSSMTATGWRGLPWARRKPAGFGE